jgi:predicted phosphoadenosine phosphosulfate sulfurtransferase
MVEFKKQLITVLSFGAGQDSTTLLYMFLLVPSFFKKYVKGKLIVVFSDTCNEYPMTYLHVEYCKHLCKKHGIEFYHLRESRIGLQSKKVEVITGFHSEAWKSLEGQMTRNRTVAMAGSKICSVNLKISPIYRFLDAYLNTLMYPEIKNSHLGHKSIVAYGEEFGKINMIIGIAHREQSRKKKADQGWHKMTPWMRDNIKRIYPLITLRFDRAKCQEYMKQSPYRVCFPSNCMMCPYQSKKAILLLWREYPRMFRKWVKYEKGKLDHFKYKEALGEKNNGAFNTVTTLAGHLKIAKKKYGHWTTDQLREDRFSNGHCMNHGV